LQTKVSLQSIKNTESGSVTSVAEINTVIGYMAAFAIYLFIFIYGAQVMRGVLEEKTNRIVEVIVSSVKPFQLMAGKIFGVVLVGLTQLMVWIILSGVFITVLSILIGGNIQNPTMPMEMTDASTINSVGDKGVASILQGLNALNLPLLLGAFVFYFLGGYLFYSALFAAIAAAVDNETDTQQFMLPVTLPLVLGIVIAMSVVTSNPHGSMAYWFSMIPFTSPVVMMVRLPFDVPLSELLLSMFLLILGFLFTTWLASRIYRVGILMYGKKATYKELWKWITYKN
jgi:ABC-2 type transport system permease protein